MDTRIVEFVALIGEDDDIACGIWEYGNREGFVVQ
jgi:hypothetical protein